MRSAFHLVNGILNFPGCSKNWNGKGVTWLHTDEAARPLAARAEKIEYFCGPIDRAFGQKERAHKLFLTLNRYHDWENTVAGHSNGADVILTMLRDYHGWPPITHLHLICAATNADFEKNGLNRWLRAGRIERVSVYVAGKDLALRLAHSFTGKLLGYGTLGLHGPTNVAEDVRERVNCVWSGPWLNYGHSGCWEAGNLPRTMRAIANLN
jgi:hypothetical protein